MVTFNYTDALYSYAYRVVNRAECDNIRYALGSWIEGICDTSEFHSEVCRALDVCLV